MPEMIADDLRAMLAALRDLLHCTNPGARLISDSDIPLFMEQSKDLLGGQEYPHPRDLIRAFLKLHNEVNANPHLQFADVLGGHVCRSQSFAEGTAQSGRFAERSI
jgi:hypothetical protein